MKVDKTNDYSNSSAKMGSGLFDLVESGTLRQLRLVLGTKCDVNCRNERHETPLMSTLIKVHDAERRQGIVLMLITYGADVNAQNARGQTPFMFACILNQPDILDILITNSLVDVNKQDIEGNTGAMYASALGNTEAVKTLVMATEWGGTDVNFRLENNEGSTALEFAIDNNDSEIIALLWRVTHGPDLDDKMTYEYQRLKTKIGQKCIQNGIKEAVKEIEECVNKENENAETEKRELVTDAGNFVSEADKHLEINPDRDKTTSHGLRSTLKLQDMQQGFVNSSQDKPKEGSNVAIDSEGQTIKEMVADAINKACHNHTHGTARQKHKTKTKKTTVKKEFGEELAVCTKLYVTDSCPVSKETSNSEASLDQTGGSVCQEKCAESGLVSFLSRSELNKFNMSQARKRSQHVFKNSEKQTDSTPKTRAKVLSGQRWSAYADPLPPILIERNILHELSAKLSEIRRYLASRSKQYSRLVTIDPEMWCILEAIKQDFGLSPDIMYVPR